MIASKFSESFITAALVIASSVIGISCSQKQTDVAVTPSDPITRTDVHGPEVTSLDPKKPVQQITIKTNDFSAPLLVHKIGQRFYFQVEATFESENFAAVKSSIASLSPQERNQKLNAEIDAVLNSLKSVQAIELSRSAEAGYVSLLIPYESSLMSRVSKTIFNRSILLNPVVHQPDALKTILAHTLKQDGAADEISNKNNAGMSGLASMKVPQFLAEVAKEIGSEPNGSAVRLGITDTGITLNHPSFLGAGNQNRIVYMGENTGEGSVYISPTSTIKAAAIDGDETALSITADLIGTPRLPALPIADRAIELKDIKIKVTPELRTLLLAEGASGAKLGILLESNFNADDEAADLNHNGKLNDQMPMIVIPGAELKDTQIFFDPSGKADFTKVAKMGDWNATHTTVKLFAETMGFHVSMAKIPNSTGQPIDVIRIGIVGFDPGNHGSHVAGIAAGFKTILNDDASTLARGVAPEAAILMNRVCTNTAGCNATQGFIDMALNGQADIINMSLGGLSPFNDGNGVQETLINRLTAEKNVLFAISAGNSGPGRQTLGSPSTARLSLSVGAAANKSMIETQYQWPGTGAGTGSSKAEDEDFMLFFSSRGPTASGGFKPNIVAPGTSLSAVQLNSATGGRSGLDVYWGTSMSAPAATGAYALLLDAIRKYNAKFILPTMQLSTNAVFLRSALIASARPFDVNRFDPMTGERLEGQYSWIDEGMGMVDLVAAWKIVKQARDQAVSASVNTANHQAALLDYDVLLDNKGPNGIAYDGSRPSADGTAAYARGIYLDFNSKDKLYQAHILRRLPADLAASEEAGDLHRLLATTQDEFVLKTFIYGSNVSWIKVGVRDELDCGGASFSRHTVIGRGAEIKPGPTAAQGGGLNPSNVSALNICVDRASLKTLSQGDHGAMIMGFRAVGDRVESIPSFSIPVYVTVPHQVMANRNAYEASKEIKSFGVDRHYIEIPKNTSLLLVTLEVPEANDNECSGVELMSLEGSNVAKSFSTRGEARVTNCNAKGAPSNDRRVLSFTRTVPTAGIWDMNVFGSYKFKKSKYKIRVDYLTAQTSQREITGGLEALKGSIEWKLLHSSLTIKPDSDKSQFLLSSLINSTPTTLKQDEQVFIESPLGALRKYPEGVKSVTVTTGGAPGSDIDMTVLECTATAAADGAEAEPTCKELDSSAGATDVESVKFAPKADRLYKVRADGFEIKGGTVVFQAGETLELEGEFGRVTVEGQLPDLKLIYAMSDEQIAASKILNFGLFKEKKYQALGSILLKNDQGVLLDTISLRISSL